VHDGGDDEPPDAIASARSARRSRASSCASQTTEELLIKSETVFAGYFRSPRRPPRCSAQTAGSRPATSRRSDADGFVTITDRKKDIIVTAGGKNIAPRTSRTTSRRRGSSRSARRRRRGLSRRR
jgi:long-chain acyl-CoA synthetase